RSPRARLRVRLPAAPCLKGDDPPHPLAAVRRPRGLRPASRAPARPDRGRRRGCGSPRDRGPRRPCLHGPARRLRRAEPGRLDGLDSRAMAVERRSPALSELLAEAAELELLASGFDFTEGPGWHAAEQ